jgi:hypothetical protein
MKEMHFVNKATTALTVREKRHYLRMKLLRKLPQYQEVVRRLVRGQSVAMTAHWLLNFEDRGPLTGCTYSTLRTYLQTLGQKVREASMTVERLDLAHLRKRAVETMDSMSEAVLKELEVPDPTRELKKMVTEEVERLDASTMLKYCFMIQKERLEEVRKIEKQTGLPMPYGNHHVKVLAGIAAEIRKVEMGIRHSFCVAPAKDGRLQFNYRHHHGQQSRKAADISLAVIGNSSALYLRIRMATEDQIAQLCFLKRSHVIQPEVVHGS